MIQSEHCEIIPASFAYVMEGAILRTSFNPQNVRVISVPCAFFTLYRASIRRHLDKARAALDVFCLIAVVNHGRLTNVLHLLKPHFSLLAFSSFSIRATSSILSHSRQMFPPPYRMNPAVTRYLRMVETAFFAMPVFSRTVFKAGRKPSGQSA